METENQKISVVIVYTDPVKLEEAIAWLQKQTVYSDVQTVVLDNRQGRFSSCAQALNYGAEHSDGDILVFMHQDIYLWDLEAMDKYRRFLLSDPDAVIGVAGVPAGRKTVTDIWETKEKLERGTRANGAVMEVDSVDECLIAMRRERWSLLRFDEICCDNWHGYGMDICFNNTLHGGRNILVPLKICHDSVGEARTASFRATIRNLVKKYHGTAIKRIHGCCLDIPCTWPGFHLYNLIGKLKTAMVRTGLLH